jgi:osmotically-inducible protein OsmY
MSLAQRTAASVEKTLNQPFTTGLQRGATAMNKKNTVIRYLVLLMMLTALVACASTSKQEGAGEYVDDTVITTKVKTAILGDDQLKVFQIGVETYKGRVQLSGFVNSSLMVEKAGQVARGVAGVKSVKNDLIVK